MQIEMNLCTLVCNSRRQYSRPRIPLLSVAEHAATAGDVIINFSPHLSLSLVKWHTPAKALLAPACMPFPQREGPRLPVRDHGHVDPFASSFHTLVPSLLTISISML